VGPFLSSPQIFQASATIEMALHPGLLTAEPIHRATTRLQIAMPDAAPNGDHGLPSADNVVPIKRRSSAA
jgi:hypothetical protein